MESARMTAKIFKHNLEEAITSRKKNLEYTVVELFHKVKVEYVVNIGTQQSLHTHYTLKNISHLLLDNPTLVVGLSKLKTNYGIVSQPFAL